MLLEKAVGDAFGSGHEKGETTPTSLPRNDRGWLAGPFERKENGLKEEPRRLLPGRVPTAAAAAAVGSSSYTQRWLSMQIELAQPGSREHHANEGIKTHLFISPSMCLARQPDV